MQFPRAPCLSCTRIKANACEERLGGGQAQGQLPGMCVCCIFNPLCKHLLRSSLHSWIHTAHEKAFTPTTLHRHTVHVAWAFVMPCPPFASLFHQFANSQVCLENPLHKGFMPTPLPATRYHCDVPAKGTGLPFHSGRW